MAETFKMFVADVVVTHREVEVPATCPNPECLADLVQESGDITVYLDQLDEVSEHAGVSRADDGELFVEAFETEGSDNVANLNVRCDACHQSVLTAPGTLRNIGADGVTTN